MTKGRDASALSFNEEIEKLAAFAHLKTFLHFAPIVSVSEMYRAETGLSETLFVLKPAFALLLSVWEEIDCGPLAPGLSEKMTQTAQALSLLLTISRLFLSEADWITSGNAIKREIQARKGDFSFMIYFILTTSIRRLSALPAAVRLSPMGLLGPKPRARTRCGSIP